MPLHELAGKAAPAEMLTNIPRIVSDYYTKEPDLKNEGQLVSFGTSGHRGCSSKQTFNENHILAITQAICMYRRGKGYTGPLFIGMDTHALSEPALVTAMEVLAANEVDVRIQADREYTPTPVISNAILMYNKGRDEGKSDGIVITPSHNPPTDGGFKYNPPEGGPAGKDATDWIAKTANEIMAEGFVDVLREPFDVAMKAETTQEYDYVQPYVDGLKKIIDFDVIKAAGLTIGADALGGAGMFFWERIADTYGLNIEIMHANPDPTFRFMSVDRDGKIRMDCSSPYAMSSLISLKDKFDIAFGNDPDFDRHGIVTPSAGLMNPNHYLAVAINYLFQNRPNWKADAAIGKTLVSSSMIDRVAKSLGRKLYEVPVGFKWFVDGLLKGSLGFGGEESAGGSFLCKDGSEWSTDKDGIIMALLAAEITAKTEKDPGVHYKELTEQFGAPVYDRIDAPANLKQKDVLKNLSKDQVTAEELAGDKIVDKLTHAPGNGAAIGGLKVLTENGWFAARPSGTEDIYKIYAESFKGDEHLKQIQEEAQAIVAKVFKDAGV